MTTRNGSGIITRSVLGMNVLGNSLGNQATTQPNSMRMKETIRGGFSFSSGSAVQEVNGREEEISEPLVAGRRGSGDRPAGESTTREAEAPKKALLIKIKNTPRLNKYQASPTHSLNVSVDAERYIASFPVVGEAQEDKSEYIRKHLLELKGSEKTRPVNIIVSLSGIKVCCRSGETVLMAHALKRISYATCHPDQCQFSFLAREPRSQSNVQYCHAFSTKTSNEAEQLNAVVADAFRRAYDHQKSSAEAAEGKWSGTASQHQLKQAAQQHSAQQQLGQQQSGQQQLGQQQQPRSFNAMIEDQIEEKRELSKTEARLREEALTQRLTQISTPQAESLAADRRERRQKELDELDLRFASTPSLVPRASSGTPGAGSPGAQPLVPRSAGVSPLARSDVNSGRVGGVKSSPTNANNVAGRLNKIRSSAGAAPLLTSNDSFPSTHSTHNISNGTSTSAAPRSSSRAIEPTNEEILTILKASLGQARTQGSPVTIFKELVDEYFRMKAANATYGTVDRLGGHALGGIDHPVARQSPKIGRKLIDAVTNRTTNWQPGHNAEDSSTNELVKIASLRQVQKPASLAYQPIRADLFSAEAGCRSSWSPSGATSRESPREEVRGKPRGREFRGVDDDVNGSEGNSPSVPPQQNIGSRVGDDDGNLNNVAWYQPGLQREVALDWLSRQEPGHFLVRDSTTHPGCYALSIKVPRQDATTNSGIMHYLVMKTNNNTFKISGLSKEWTSLTGLVTHHTVMKEILPCVLILPSSNALTPSGGLITTTSVFNRDEVLNY